jgi:dephospho-CoA kinase
MTSSSGTLRVALTGGIATGKSYVRARVAARGVPTIDSDGLVHSLLAPGSPVVAAIEARFGAQYVRPDGSADRRAIGRLVFGDPAARRDLESIIHPRVYDLLFAWADEQARAGARWILADVPLLFETGRQDAFDRVIVTACPVDVQLRRLTARDGVTEAEARARLAAQWPVESKVRLANLTIRTDGTFEETDRQVDDVVRVLDDVARRAGA